MAPRFAAVVLLGWGFENQLCVERERLTPRKSYRWGQRGSMCFQDPPINVGSLRFETCCMNGGKEGDTG